VSATLSGHSRKVTALTFAGDSVVVSGSADKTVRAWRRDPDDASKWTIGYTYEAPAAVVQVCTFFAILLSPSLWFRCSILYSDMTQHWSMTVYKTRHCNLLACKQECCSSSTCAGLALVSLWWTMPCEADTRAMCQVRQMTSLPVRFCRHAHTQ
jgi:WD40 repeat protein